MADTLREYLISLGWNIDEASWRRYEGALLRTGEATFKVGAVAVETGIAIEAMVTRVARKYEDLYYTSQRTGRSVAFLQSTQFGFRQIGLTADQATGAVEGVARAIRLNPGLKALVGGENDPTKIMDRLSKLPYFVGARFAEMFGIPEDVFLQYVKFADVEKKAADQRRERLRAAGLDPKDVAEHFTAFGREMHTLGSDVETLWDRIAYDFLNFNVAGVSLESVIGKVDELVHWLSGADSTTKQAVRDVGALGTTAVAGWIITGVLGRVLRLLGLVRTTAAAAAESTAAVGAAGAAPAAAAAKATRGGVIASEGGAFLGGASFAATGAALAGIAALGWTKNDPGHKKRSALRAFFGIPETEEERNAPDQLSADAGRRSSGIAQHVVDYFVSQGWTRAQAVGIAANLKRESGLDPLKANNQGLNFFGLAQWDASRQAAFARWAGHSIRQSTLDEQLAFVQWELTHGERFAAGLLRRAGSPADAARAFSRAYERTDHPEREEPLRAGLADELSASLGQQYGGGDSHDLTVNQKTDIHVTGGGGAQTAQLILDKQNTVNDGLVRNLVGATR